MKQIMYNSLNNSVTVVEYFAFAIIFLHKRSKIIFSELNVMGKI